ncbi:hypothetical protein HIM_09811 [Hirsutella minnesotensis 3608]|uniref:Uncharacterized protein n=1 Tax=Hirsutella minnesotensis 3608 TaxID=1043627 RepID=A0A0F7ZS60_9HYPO|nr:hypothetical protein HIM_09811 [Hirsutella minnesotensis 3608]
MTTSDSCSVWSDSTTSSTALSQASARLLGEEDDLLVPTAADIERTYHDGRATWGSFLHEAVNIPQGLWPTALLDPYITLFDVPALPSELPRSDILHGRPRWYLRQCAQGSGYAEVSVSDDDWDPAFVYGRRVAFCLGYQDAVSCDILSQPASSYLGLSSKTRRSISVLTLCWSYILSARFLEMQGRRVRYTTHQLQLQKEAEPERSTLYLDGASPELVRWLCAILCPKLGWFAPGKLLPPWAASIKADLGLAVLVPVTDAETLDAPNSTEAIDLLLELCRLCGLGAEADRTEEGRESLPPYKAGFFAALMLPFYRFMSLRPQFPPPHLNTKATSRLDNADQTNIRRFVHDLRYFMTLSLHPPSLGTILWSIFWQPDVECNLVSPWLAAVLDTLNPTINAMELETLVKVFASRRPKIAFWWLALFLLGDISVTEWIRRYAQTQTEKYGFAPLSPPDPMVSAWTGSKQSFLDYEKTSSYTESSDLVSRADLLRCRFDCKLQDSASTTLSWRPFGYSSKQYIEPDLWPRLEAHYVRQYHSFTWYPRKKRWPTSFGFRQESGRATMIVPDNLELRLSGGKCRTEYSHDIKLAPSKKTTLTMLSLLVEDSAGTRHWANAAIPDIRSLHPWLHNWEGLDVMERADTEILNADIAPTGPSWFLQEWMEGKHQNEE